LRHLPVLGETCGKMQSYRTPQDLEKAIAWLIRVEPRFADVHRAHGTPSLRSSSAGLDGLLMIVTEQFLSLAAARAIWTRIVSVIEPLTAAQLATRSHADLLGLGLSNAKVRTFLAAAEAVRIGRLDFDRLVTCDNADVHKVLCALPGVGPWTADIYLLSCLARTDAWPVGDLALQAAVQNLFDLRQRPSPKEMLKLAEAWRPHRAAAARLLWAHYRSVKGLGQAVLKLRTSQNHCRPYIMNYVRRG
jgi:DNA-3-methyladenine glycosylase II